MEIAIHPHLIEVCNIITLHDIELSVEVHTNARIIEKPSLSVVTLLHVNQIK